MNQRAKTILCAFLAGGEEADAVDLTDISLFPLEVAEAGHFVPEWGEPIARTALAHFRLG